MSRTTRPVMQLDSQARALPSSGDWTTFRGDYWPGTTNLRYAGMAKPGTATSIARWQICYLQYDAANNLLSILWPTNADGVISNDYEFIWDNRAALVYA